MQPSGQHRTIRELGGVFGQCEEGGLGYVLGEVYVTNHAARGGMDEVNVPSNEFGERGFGTPGGVSAKQLSVGLSIHSPESSRRLKNRTEIVASGISA
ncbi:MAG: hypothetical protein M9920_15090 [Verrucomicrobiae bacterium]|nr:hypothetical protein [Verrucomicrobiae bacterium]